MKYHFFTYLIVLIIRISGTSQNAFLDLYHPYNANLIALRTDSLILSTYENANLAEQRVISYEYLDDESLPPNIVEFRKMTAGQYDKRITEQAHWDGRVLVVEWASFDSILLIEQKKRSFKAFNEFGLADSLWVEFFDGTEWVKSRKTLFSYTDSKLLKSRTEFRYGNTASEWIDDNLIQFTYFPSGKIRTKTEEVRDGSEWKLQNSYSYEYLSEDGKPSIAVWYGEQNGRLIPVDSLKTWYNENGLQDSSFIYTWDWNANRWEEAGRKFYNDQDQKTTGFGNEYFIDNQRMWRANKQSFIAPGDQIFTNEPKEILLSEFDPVTFEWKDKSRKVINYQYIDTVRVHGTIEIFEIDSSTQGWQTAFLAEAWFSILDEGSEFGQEAEDRSRQFKFSYTCDLPNPYVRNMTISFPETEAVGSFNLTIFSSEGRLVFEKKFGDSGSGYVDAPLQPGVYWVTLQKGSTPLCTQKLIVN